MAKLDWEKAKRHDIAKSITRSERKTKGEYRTRDILSEGWTLEEFDEQAKVVYQFLMTYDGTNQFLNKMRQSYREQGSLSPRQIKAIIS